MYIDPCIYTSRPEAAGHLEKEMAVYDLLDGLGVAYERVEHEVTPSIEACRDVEAMLDIEICKNLFLCNRQKTDFYLLMMPGDKAFHTKDLSRQIGSARLSFASPDFMEEFLNLTPGSVSVLGLMNDKEKRVRLLIDEDVLKNEFLGCHPCINTASLKLRTRDLLDKILPAVEHTWQTVSL